MKKFQFKLHKFCLGVALIGSGLLVQEVLACTSWQDDTNIFGGRVYKNVRCTPTEGVHIVTFAFNDKMGFMTTNGKRIASGTYFDDVRDFSEGLAGVQLGSKWAFINKAGEVVVPYRYEYVYSFMGGLARVKKDGKWGIINTTGQEIIPMMYDDIDYQKDSSLFAVKKDGKWGFVDGKNVQVINFQYTDVRTPFSSNDDGAIVSFGDDNKTPKYFEINKTGKIVTPRITLDDFRKKIQQGDDIYYKTEGGQDVGMILEIKGNLVQIQTTETKCTQRDYKGNCDNYITDQVSKWVKKNEIYPENHF